MPGGAARIIGRAIVRAAARAAAERGAAERGVGKYLSRSERRAAEERGGRRGERDREGRRGGRFGGLRGGLIDAGEGGADFVTFESTAVEAAERGMQAMLQMAANRGQVAILEEVAPKFGRYAAQLAESGGSPSWMAMRNMTDHYDAVEDILNEGFQHLVEAYKDDVYQEALQLAWDDEDETDGLEEGEGD